MLSYSETAATASTSTVMPFGKEATPTAERACRPASPKTSTNKSEQPLITAGCSQKSGAALTIPNIFSIFTTRLRDPSDSRIAASKTIPAQRAWFRASSAEMFSPTFPVASRPQGSRGPCPDKNSNPPSRRTGRKFPTGAGAVGKTMANSRKRSSGENVVLFTGSETRKKEKHANFTQIPQFLLPSRGNLKGGLWYNPPVPITEGK